MSVEENNLVHLCVWSGEAQAARAFVRSRFPQALVVEFAARSLRGGGWGERIRFFRRLRGQAVVFYFARLDEFKHAHALLCLHMLHGCKKTVLSDDSGKWRSWQTANLLLAAPRGLFAIAKDLKSLVSWWFYLRFLRMRASPAGCMAETGELDIAYLIPTQENQGTHGGAISHIRGVLYGLKDMGKTCRVFAGAPLAQEYFGNEVVGERGPACFFWEAGMLRYNFEFAAGVVEHLQRHRPSVFYQRHCRFAVGGALLSRRLQIPLILEYNGPQRWMAEHWDPTPFKRLIHLCEEVSLRSASRIVVVSQALQEELLQRGIAAERITLNPNGVDVELFSPGRGRAAGRARLSAKQHEVLIGFVGSFSLWHGIEVLQQAILALLREELPCSLGFVLVGEGLLREEMRSALREHERTGRVVFTGPQPRESVVEYLDAADILVSPHVPMPDGSRFFGSPTKLFEYMAMGKAIVASRLEQIAEVLEHERTALLVSPGSADELAAAIARLALDPKQRAALGSAARQAVMERYTWAHNVAIALDGTAVEQRQVETVGN